MSEFELPIRPLTRREWRRTYRQAPVGRAIGDGGASGFPVVLMVCTGNICRSPLAEALLRERLRGFGVTVQSAGTRARNGDKMVGLSQTIAIRNGADPEEVAAHRARWLIEPLADDADLILAMSRQHRTASVELSPRHLRRSFTLREFARLTQGMSADEIREAADYAGETPRDRIVAVASLAAQRRGSAAPPSEQDDDVIDPYRREPEIYEESARQLVPAVDEVARVLRSVLARR
ncbi:arsenate reductase/protein-tyrosine-phosphatase family protein [Microbacterium sp. USHLN272]|uniref:arsenate reductase/protein-tyrosine-phosphatase family protein n=1 Tax=Microbacterium sp. USHLN272 TaxID=3081287 RepID=UPI0030199A23